MAQSHKNVDVKQKRICAFTYPQDCDDSSNMDGNKSTSRLLENIILYRLNVSIVKWDFSNHILRTQYQRRFGFALVSGNLGSGLEFHRRVPGFPRFIEATQGQYYENLGITLFGERETTR